MTEREGGGNVIGQSVNEGTFSELSGGSNVRTGIVTETIGACYHEYNCNVRLTIHSGGQPRRRTP